MAEPTGMIQRQLERIQVILETDDSYRPAIRSDRARLKRLNCSHGVGSRTQSNIPHHQRRCASGACPSHQSRLLHIQGARFFYRVIDGVHHFTGMLVANETDSVAHQNLVAAPLQPTDAPLRLGDMTHRCAIAVARIEQIPLGIVKR